jgi:hypothetical protein
MASRRQSRTRRQAEVRGARPPRMLAWWYRRQDRRIVARGGAVPTSLFTDELPSPDPFRPTPVNEAEITARITELANGLLPGAVDEAIGHALDNLINARVDQWCAQVEAEYAEYRGRVRFRQRQALATVEQETILRKRAERRLVETELALNATIGRLLGQQTQDRQVGRLRRRRRQDRRAGTRVRSEVRPEEGGNA